MEKGRLEAFTDGVVAIIITIMVLELRVPEDSSWEALRGSLPVFLTYVLAYVNVGLYWNNHHHMLQAAERIDGRVLWANLFLLFWLSLVPFVIRWIDETGFTPLPVAAYGVVLGMAAVGYTMLARCLLACNGPESLLRKALGHDWKGKVSLALYGVGIALAYFSPAAAIAIYIAIAAVWLVPDRRIEDRVQS